MEVWKDIKNYEGLYQVSNMGRIKSLSRTIMLKGKYPFTSKEKIMKTQTDINGYLFINLSNNGKSKCIKCHQLVAESFLNHIRNGHKLVVNHKNFIRNDNRVENLEIITMRENGNQKHLKSSSKYTGVSWCKLSRKYKSHIHINGKTKCLGSFTNEKEASLYYENALIAFNNNQEIVTKKTVYTRCFKGGCYDKKRKKWIVSILINGKSKYLGRFSTQPEAVEAYNLAFSNINS